MSEFQQLGSQAVRDSIEAVFRSGEFASSLGDTILDRVLDFLVMLFVRLAQIAEENPFLYWSGVALLVLALVALLVRGALLAGSTARFSSRRHRSDAAAVDTHMSEDPWRSANALAASGNYTEAAHELYRYLVEWLSARNIITPHHSKTVGDYSREARSRSAQVFAGFRTFARSYEHVIYGLQGCDRERFERLLALATTVTNTSAR